MIPLNPTHVILLRLDGKESIFYLFTKDRLFHLDSVRLRRRTYRNDISKKVESNLMKHEGKMRFSQQSRENSRFRVRPLLKQTLPLLPRVEYAETDQKLLFLLLHIFLLSIQAQKEDFDSCRRRK